MSDFSSIPPAAAGGSFQAARLSEPGLLPTGKAGRPVGLNGAGAENRIAGQTEAAGDRVELSDFAVWLDRMRQLPDIRSDRVEQVRQAIANGTYDTDEKLDAALDAMINELSSE